MKPFYVLLASFIIVLLGLKFFTGTINYSLSGNIAMSMMLVFTAIGHFAFTRGMEMMMPDFIPARKILVYTTGMIEIAAAVGLLISSLHILTAYLLILFFILILPVNIYAAIKKVDYQKSTYDGPGTSYLWFRVPMQLFLIAWVYYFNIYQ